jgi:hypothetical protein
VLAAGSELTPIPIEDETANLSAILLDDAYYAFIIAGRKERDGLRWIGEEQLIPLKAHAWLDLNARRKPANAVGADKSRRLALLSPSRSCREHCGSPQRDCPP